jgi:hypothetical protein
LSQLTAIFLNNLLPIFLIAGAGYLLGHYTQVNLRSLSQLILYVFSPCLIFTLLTQSQLDGNEIARAISLAATSIVLTGMATWLISKALRFSPAMISGVLLASMFMNAGNYGMPVVLFAFGQEALSYASLFFVTSAACAYTIGIVIASSGSTSIGRAMLNLFKLPMIYGILAALLFMYTGWDVPLPIERATQLLGDASLPSMLLLLGLQLKKATWSNHVAPLGLASAMRLLVSPLITLLLAPLFGISPVARQAFVLESAMPTAVLTTVIATEFNAEPTFVTTAVFITTLLSPLTLTPLMAWLGA